MAAKSWVSTSVRWLKRIGTGFLALVVVAALIGSVYEAVSRHRAHERYPPPGKLVDIGGRKMHINCRGTGSPTVVFESGLDALGSLSWDKVQDSVASLTRACSYDRAGIMWSDPKSGHQDADTVAQDLHATLQASGVVGPLVLVCHSLGGPYVMDYTRQFGDAVKGVVFVDCSHPDQAARLGKIASTETPLSYRALNALRWSGLTRLVFVDSEPNEPERIKAPAGAYAAESFDGVMKELESLDATFREGGKLRTLGDRPVVVLTAMAPFPKDAMESVGLTEQDIPPLRAKWESLGQDIASWSTHSRQQTVPESIHYIQFDRPDLVVQAITEVVTAVRSADPAYR